MPARVVDIQSKELMPLLRRRAENASVPALEYARADIACEVVRRRISAGMG